MAHSPPGQSGLQVRVEDFAQLGRHPVGVAAATGGPFPQPGHDDVLCCSALPAAARCVSPRHSTHFTAPAAPVGNSASRLAPLVDVRAAGGYIIPLGSRTPPARTRS